jgi:hypothetical protein
VLPVDLPVNVASKSWARLLPRMSTGFHGSGCDPGMTDPSVVGQHQVSGDSARGEQTASYFDLKNPGSPESDCVDAPPGRFRLTW